MKSRPLIQIFVASVTLSKNIARHCIGRQQGGRTLYMCTHVCRRHEHTGVMWRVGWTRTFLEATVEEVVEGACALRSGHGHLGWRANSRKDDTGSRASSMLRLWNSMKGAMSRTEAGASYLTPCFTVSDLRRRCTGPSQ